jgi:hypothetical protein
MQLARCDWQLIVVLLIAALFLSACSSFIASISPPPEDQSVLAEARDLLALLENQNQDLTNFKGTGKITFRENNQKGLDARVAWIGSTPAKIRIAVHSFSGQPVISFASDGQWYYFFSHTDSQFFKKRATSAGLKRFFSIPINSDDIVNILAGRIPLRKHNRAILNKQGSDSNNVLILKRRWGSHLEKIYFGEHEHQVRKVEMFDSSGALVYGVEFCGMRTIKNYQVPACLRFRDEAGHEVQLDIDRYWADAPVSASVFVLTPPE